MGERTEAELLLHLERLGFDTQGVTVDAHGTLTSAPSRQIPLRFSGLSLPTATVGEAPASSADFELGALIGAGGMGEVRSARQSALDRTVAVKFLKDGKESSTHLLQEAIVTGRLEHPNIIPVHVLALTTDGEPFFAMKRVEGTPWSHSLKAGRPLVEHLEVLQRVCDAVGFAHARGVVHRDLKPDNVMLGTFGEVYVVDWGLAVSLEDDGVLPPAKDAGVAGTPGYMAPEMVDAKGVLSAQSDVYLLGAVLHEIVTGRPPHEGDDPVKQLLSAWRGPVLRFDASVPLELVTICQKALAYAPRDRFASAAALKEALTAFLRHREALELYAQARARLKQLEQAVSDGGVMRSLYGVQAQETFTECRFGFEQVRRLWPEFEGARDGVRQAVLLMLGHELARDDARAAKALLRQLDDPPAALERQVAEAERRALEKQARFAELERNEGEREIDLALDTKARFSFVFGIVTAVVSVSVQAAVDLLGLEPTTGQAAGVFSVTIITSTVFSVALGRARETNLAQKRIGRVLGATALEAVLLWVCAWWLGVPLGTALTLYLVMVSSNWAVGAVLFDTRAWAICAAFAIATPVCLAFPRFIFLISGLATLAGFGTLGLLMRAKANHRVTPPRATGP